MRGRNRRKRPAGSCHLAVIRSVYRVNLLLTPEGGPGLVWGSWGPPFVFHEGLRTRAQLSSIVSRPNRHEPFPSPTFQAVAWADRSTRRRARFRELGIASCRDRVCQTV